MLISLGQFVMLRENSTNLVLVALPVSQLNQEVSVGGGESSNERVFPCLDCSFCGVHLVVVGFD
jgi:hypothetical protein